MSHLTILPTVLRDAQVLASALISLGHQPQWGGAMVGFADAEQPVMLQVSVVQGRGQGVSLGWLRQADGSLAMVGDLQRLSRSLSAQRLLGQITRSYAAQLALREAAEHFGPGQVTLVR